MYLCCVVIVRISAAVFGALIDYLYVGSCVCALVGYQRRYLPHIVLVKLMIGMLPGWGYCHVKKFRLDIFPKFCIHYQYLYYQYSGYGVDKSETFFNLAAYQRAI